MGSLKIGCALWSLGVGPTDEKMEETLDRAVAIGVKAVQPWCVDEARWKLTTVLDPDRCTAAQRKDWVKRIHAKGLEISGFCAQNTGDTFGNFAPGEGLEARIQKTGKALQLAADMGSPVVTTHVGVVPDDRNDPEYKRYVECAKKVAKAGEESGGIFALETGQESAEVLKMYIEDIGSEAVKVNYDPANMLKWGTVEGVSILKDYIVHAHAKDKNDELKISTVGKGDVPWDEYMAAIKAIGYSGWHALEDETGKDIENSLKFGLQFLQKY